MSSRSVAIDANRSPVEIAISSARAGVDVPEVAAITPHDHLIGSARTDSQITVVTNWFEELKRLVPLK